MIRLVILILLYGLCSTTSSAENNTAIDKLLNEYASSGDNTGMIIGVIDCHTEHIDVFSKGPINVDDDLRLVCPASKPLISYLTLKNGIDINSNIEEWFPLSQGYKKSDEITIKMLLSNTSGIKDYVGVSIDQNRICTAQFTVDTVYKYKELAFNPEDSVLYSNTGFNMAGIILEKETNTTFNNLISNTFHETAPSLRIDDGLGKYPQGYVNPWPYHFSQSGFAGGIIGNIKDYLRMMCLITKQQEFKTMTDWVKHIDGLKWGLGLFSQNNFIMYKGNSGANLSFFIKIDSKIIYFHTTNEINDSKFQIYINQFIPLLLQLNN